MLRCQFLTTLHRTSQFHWDTPFKCQLPVESSSVSTRSFVDDAAGVPHPLTVVAPSPLGQEKAYTKLSTFIGRPAHEPDLAAFPETAPSIPDRKRKRNINNAATSVVVRSPSSCASFNLQQFAKGGLD